MGPARGQMPGRRRAASCYLPTLLPGIFLNFLPPSFSFILRQILSYFLVVRRAVGPLAMAIRPNTCPLAFSPSDTVSFSGFFLPQPPPAFLLAADVPYIVLVSRFHPFNYRLVEGLRVYMLNLGDSSREFPSLETVFPLLCISFVVLALLKEMKGAKKAPPSLTRAVP